MVRSGGCNLKGENKVFSSESESQIAYEHGLIDLRAKIKVKLSKPLRGEKKPEIVQTSIGRIIFNRSLPEDFGFVNYDLDQKNLRELGAEILKDYGEDVVVDFLDKMKSLGFHYWSKKD